MAAVPQRTAVAGFFRGFLTAGERYIPVPDVNPSVWTMLGLVASVACLYTPSAAVKFWLVTGVMITDWYDGATARRHGRSSREGYMIDVAVDRFSEGFIFLADVATSMLARVFFVLFVVNTVLSLWSFASGRHVILPLRIAWMFVLFFWWIGG